MAALCSHAAQHQCRSEELGSLRAAHMLTIGSIFGLYCDIFHLIGENQMDDQMENEMETAICRVIQGLYEL